MKTFFLAAIAVLAFTTVQGLTDEQKTKLQATSEKCVAETGADKTLIEKARKKDFTEDEKLMAYYFCMFKTLKWQNDDGSINVDLIVSKLPAEKRPSLEGIVKGCADDAKGSSSPQLAAFKAYKCFVEKSNEEITLK